MLEKSSIFLMLLLGAGSLIGISSIYQPASVETQPQPQQPQQQLIRPTLYSIRADNFNSDHIL
jgi:hypothetical protein